MNKVIYQLTKLNIDDEKKNDEKIELSLKSKTDGREVWVGMNGCRLVIHKDTKIPDHKRENPAQDFDTVSLVVHCNCCWQCKLRMNNMHDLPPEYFVLSNGFPKDKNAYPWILGVAFDDGQSGNLSDVSFKRTRLLHALATVWQYSPLLKKFQLKPDQQLEIMPCAYTDIELYPCHRNLSPSITKAMNSKGCLVLPHDMAREVVAAFQPSTNKNPEVTAVMSVTPTDINNGIPGVGYLTKTLLKTIIIKQGFATVLGEFPDYYKGINPPPVSWELPGGKTDGARCNFATICIEILQELGLDLSSGVRFKMNVLVEQVDDKILLYVFKIDFPTVMVGNMLCLPGEEQKTPVSCCSANKNPFCVDPQTTVAPGGYQSTPTPHAQGNQQWTRGNQQQPQNNRWAQGNQRPTPAPHAQDNQRSSRGNQQWYRGNQRRTQGNQLSTPVPHAQGNQRWTQGNQRQPQNNRWVQRSTPVPHATRTTPTTPTTPTDGWGSD